MAWVESALGAESMSNVLASQSLNREAMRAHAALYRTVMFGPSNLSRVEREAISVAVSSLNGCGYCRIHHSAAVLEEGGKDDLVEAAVCQRPDGHGPRLEALLRYATKLTADPAGVVEEDLAPLRAAGLSDRDIVDAQPGGRVFQLREPGRQRAGRRARTPDWGTDAVKSRLITSATESSSVDPSERSPL